MAEPAAGMLPARRVSWALVVAGVLAGMLVEATIEPPAGLLRWGVASASAGLLRLDDPQGGLWDGSGRLAWIRSGWPEVPLGRWQWSMALVHGAPGVRLTALEGPVVGGLSAAFGIAGTSLEDVALQVPAGDLPTGLGTLDFLHPGGQLVLASPHLRLRGGKPAGNGRLEWRQASTRLVALAPLGSWHADWEADDAGIAYRVATDAGPLHVQGQGRIGADGRPSLQGRAWSDPDAAASLQPVLQLLGQPEGDGSVPISWR